MKTNLACRICRSDRLALFLDLGEQPLANALLDREALEKPEPRYPLRVFFCENCNLAGLREIIRPEVLFRDYVYFTSAMPRVPEHFRKYAEEAVRRFTVSPDDLVLEIGSNDGILLSAIKDRVRVLGVDPALNIAKVANECGVPTIAEFFDESLARRIREEHGPAAVIIGNNVVAHIDDHHDLLRGVKALLRHDGAFILEAPYLLDMFDRLAFDSIYHEHLSYLAIRPLARLAEEFGMEIFDAKLYPVQGKSIRVFIGHKGAHPVAPAVGELVAWEIKRGLNRYETYQALAVNIHNLRETVRTMVYALKAKGARLAAYGAPARGNTLLNYFGLGRDVLEYATDELPSKVGRYTPGSHLPIIHIKEARNNPPDYFLLLAWNYRDAVLEKEAQFRGRGGKFIIPVGSPEII